MRTCECCTVYWTLVLKELIRLKYRTTRSTAGAQQAPKVQHTHNRIHHGYDDRKCAAHRSRMRTPALHRVANVIARRKAHPRSVVDRCPVRPARVAPAAQHVSGRVQRGGHGGEARRHGGDGGRRTVARWRGGAVVVVVVVVLHTTVDVTVR